LLFCFSPPPPPFPFLTGCFFTEEFAKFLIYARGLKFEETPDYDHLYKLINQVMKRSNLVDDGIYDWMPEAGKVPKSDPSARKASDNAAVPPKPAATTPAPKAPENVDDEPTPGCCGMRRRK